MAMRLNPYISFLDTAEAAMSFYQSVLGGELTLMRFSEMGDEGPTKDLVMHSQLLTDAGFCLMGSDTPPGMDYVKPAGITISISGDDAEAMRGWFAALAEGGTVSMPLEKQVWGDEFGALVDRFGIDWLVNIAGDTQG